MSDTTDRLPDDVAELLSALRRRRGHRRRSAPRPRPGSSARRRPGRSTPTLARVKAVAAAACRAVEPPAGFYERAPRPPVASEPPEPLVVDVHPSALVASGVATRGGMDRARRRGRCRPASSRRSTTSRARQWSAPARCALVPPGRARWTGTSCPSGVRSATVDGRRGLGGPHRRGGPASGRRVPRRRRRRLHAAPSDEVDGRRRPGRQRRRGSPEASRVDGDGLRRPGPRRLRGASSTTVSLATGSPTQSTRRWSCYAAGATADSGGQRWRRARCGGAWRCGGAPARSSRPRRRGRRGARGRTRGTGPCTGQVVADAAGVVDAGAVGGEEHRRAGRRGSCRPHPGDRRDRAISGSCTVGRLLLSPLSTEQAADRFPNSSDLSDDSAVRRRVDAPSRRPRR